jgi:hypothetical protein
MHARRSSSLTRQFSKIILEDPLGGLAVLKQEQLPAELA